MLVVYGMFHLYDAYRYTAAEEFRRILLAVSLGVGGVLALSFWSKASSPGSWLAALVGVRHRGGPGLAAAVARAHRPPAGTTVTLSFPTLIVGTNAEAVHLVDAHAASVLRLPSARHGRHQDP